MTPDTVTAPPLVDAPSYLRPLLVQIGFLSFAFHRNVDGVSHEESLRSPEPGGNCLNWVVGHIVAARQGWLLRVLHQQPVTDPATLEVYRRGSEPLRDSARSKRLEELVALYDASQQPLLDGMSALSASRLAEPAPFSPRNDPHETIGSLVATLTFHEAYHTGQTGVLRRLLGHPGGIA